MITNTMSYIFMFFCYMTITASIFNMRFGIVHEDQFGTFFLSVRTLFDAMSSNYKFTDYNVYQRSYDIFIILHLILTRIFLLNYLVALLSSIYKEMIVHGEYQYIKIKFSFYKRFQSIFKTKKHYDQKGKNCVENLYCELSMHPPPENNISFYFLLVCFPLIFRREWRLKVFKYLSLTIYWVENIVFLSLFLGLDMALGFLVYFKVQLIFFIKIAQKRKALLFAAYWLLLGFPIVIFMALRDAYSLFKILKKNGNIKQKKKEQAKKIKHRYYRGLQASILNDVIESMRQLYEEIEQDQAKKYSKKLSSNLQLLTKYKNTDELVHKLKEIKKENLQQQKMDTSFTIDKDLIIMTWLKLRKDRIFNARLKYQEYSRARLADFERRSGLYFKQLSRAQQMGTSSNLGLRAAPTQLLSKKYVQKVIEQNYNQRKSSSMPRMTQNQSRTNMSITKFIKNMNKKLSSKEANRRKSFLSKNRKDSSSIFSRDNMHYYRSSQIQSLEEEQEFEFKIQTAVDEQMLELIENFLNKFIFVSKYQGHNQVNLKLCLSALPQKLTSENQYKLELINFVKVQMAMVSFQNQKSDQLFNYYDTRNKARIHQLNYQAQETQELSKELLNLSLATKNKLVKLFKLEREFKKMEKKRKQEKDVIRINIQQHPDIKKSTNTVTSDKTTSLFPVIEESEYGDFDMRQSSNVNSSHANRANITSNSANFRFDQSSYVSTPPKTQEGAASTRQADVQESQSQINNSQRRSFIDQSMEYSIQHSQDENDDTNSNSSFTSFSDIIKEETESNLSSNSEEGKSQISQL